MTHTVYELDVRLCDIQPPIWRTIEVPGASSLADVHHAIQCAMGWTNSHLHQFEIRGRAFGMVDPDGGGDPEGFEDERNHRLEDAVAPRTSFIYEYDFGDDWRHKITVKRVTRVAEPPTPRCTAGARACPPEDCGGPHGYARLLDALADPRTDEAKELCNWAGDFDPELFSLPKGGRDLADEIDEARELAGDSVESDQAAGLPSEIDVPEALVQATLALPPMQRAALGAIIAGSLVDEVVRLDATIGLLQRHAAAPPNRKRRSRRKA
jgi:hypothetical protein